MRLQAFFLCVSYLCGLPVFAASWFIPSVTNATANGVTRVTELRVLNQGNAAAELQFSLLPNPGQTAAAPVKMTIQARASLLVSDPLGTLFGLKGTTAALQISAVQPLFVLAQTSAANASGGALRSSMPVIADTDMLRAGEAGHLIWVAQSAAQSSSFAVALADPQNSAQLTVYDAAGNQVAQQTFTGGPQFTQVSLRTLVAKDVPLGRAFFVVTLGKAACNLQSTDAVTGDVMLTAPQQYFEGATDVLIPGVQRTIRDDGQLARTDLRLYNFGAAAATVTVTPQAVAGDGVSATGTINVGPHALTEVRDALATVLGASGNGLGALRFQSDQSVLILARQGLGLPDGSNGATGDALATRLSSDLLPMDSVLEFAGVRQSDQTPGVHSVLAFAAGPAGAAADVTVRDPGGQILAQSADGLLQLDPNGYLETSLAALFPDTAFPDETVVDVHVSSGSLLGHEVFIDNGTADVAIVAAGPLSSAYVCLPPAIIDFSALPAGLTAAGPVDLSWTADADYVQLNPGNLTLAAEGTQTFTVPAAGATYTVEAFNACGSVKQTLAVLPLTNPGTLSVTPAAARPGQMITLHFGQQDLTGLQGVEFEMAGTLQYVAPVVQLNDNGDVVVVVPALPDPGKPASVLSGAAILRPSLPDAAKLPGPSFTVQPLVYTGNAITEFRQLVGYLTTQAHTNFAAITQVYSAPEELNDGGALVDQYARILNKIADDLAAKGNATAPVDAPSLLYPNPDTFTITVADLQDYLAYLHVLAGTDQLIPTFTQPVLPRLDPKQGGCIQDSDRFYQACLLFSRIPLNGVLKTAANGFWGFAADAISKLMGRSVDAAQLACYLSPLVPQSFRVGPTDFVLPGKIENKQMIAQLGPYWNKKQLIDSIVEPAVKHWSQVYATDVKKGVAPATAAKQRDDRVAAAKKWAETISEAAAKVSGRIAEERTVGRCELRDVSVVPNFRKNLVRRPQDEHGNLDYTFKGKKQGEGNLSLQIDPTEFVDFHRSDSQLIYQAPISVGKPKRTLKIEQFYALVPPQRYDAGGLPVTLRDGQKYQSTITIAGNKYLLKVIPKDQGVWQVDLTVTRPDGGTPGAPRCMLVFTAQRKTDPDSEEQLEVDLSSSGNAPQLGSLNPPPATADISSTARVDGKASFSALTVSAQNGASVAKKAAKLHNIGASSATITTSVMGRGFSPNMTVSATIMMEDNPK